MGCKDASARQAELLAREEEEELEAERERREREERVETLAKKMAEETLAAEI